MKAPKKPTQNNLASKPLSSKKESDEDDDDEIQDNEVLDEEEDDFDVPLDDLDTFLKNEDCTCYKRRK